MDTRSLIKKVLAKDDTGLECIVNTLEEALCYVQRVDASMYQHLAESLEQKAYEINPDEAKSIVQKMKPMGQQWSWQQIEDYISSKEIDPSCTEKWYLVMNMVYNDYYNTAKTFGHLNDVEFFFHLAKDFIEDPDAQPLKVEKYFM
nr:MAG TPA: hypothetical protein [Caudoviricetes sp.]